jgi:predicted nucleic acid-binding protein
MHFVDTNVLVYSISTNPGERRKRDAAARILDAPDLSLSIQVLQEFYAQATRPGFLSHDEAVGLVHSFCRFRVQEMTMGILESAMATRQRYRISYWDAAIIEAARALGCRTVLSEDLNAGQNYGGVRVVNPFA